MCVITLLFTENTEYEKKMVWLQGLANIQLGRVVEFLEPIASGNSGESRHLRALAAWASLPSASLRPDVVQSSVEKLFYKPKKKKKLNNESINFY